MCYTGNATVQGDVAKKAESRHSEIIAVMIILFVFLSAFMALHSTRLDARLDAICERVECVEVE